MFTEEKIKELKAAEQAKGAPSLWTLALTGLAVLIISSGLLLLYLMQDNIQPLPTPIVITEATRTLRPTPTLRSTRERVATSVPTDTPQPTATSTATPTGTDAPTYTPYPTLTALPTYTPYPTATAIPTETSTATPTAQPSPSPTAAVPLVITAPTATGGSNIRQGIVDAGFALITIVAAYLALVQAKTIRMMADKPAAPPTPLPTPKLVQNTGANTSDTGANTGATPVQLTVSMESAEPKADEDALKELYQIWKGLAEKEGVRQSLTQVCREKWGENGKNAERMALVKMAVQWGKEQETKGRGSQPPRPYFIQQGRGLHS